MDGAITDADDAIKKAEELLEKKTLTKADRVELLNLIHSVQKSVKNGAPFVYKQFISQMEKTATEVKGELESWQLSRVTELAALGLAVQERPEELPDVPTVEFNL